MGKLGKALLHSSLLLLVLGIAAVFYLDRIVAGAIEVAGSRALGVPTHVHGVKLGLVRGRVALDGLSIENPQGFSDERFLEVGSIRVEAPPRSLLGDPVVIPSIVLEDVALSLEGSTQGTNYGQLLRSAGASGGGKKASTASAESAGKKFIVRELRVTKIRAHLTLGSLADTSIELPEIRLQDLGSEVDGIALAELIGRVTRDVVQGVVRKQPELASQLGRELRDRLESGAASAGEGFEKGVEQLRERGLRGVLPPER